MTSKFFFFCFVLITAVGVCTKYVVKGIEEAKKEFGTDNASEEIVAMVKYLEAVETVKHTSDEQVAARIVEEYQLCKEHIPTVFANSVEVRFCLLVSIAIITMTCLFAF